MEKSPSWAATGSVATPSRRKISITVVATVLLCLLSTARLLTETLREGRLENSAGYVARQSDERFADLRKVLPQRGVVGYVGDPGETSPADYYLAQYALAPLVVERSTEHWLVVGNFPASQSSPPSGIEKSLLLVRNFGNGLFLFARKDSK
jgi:hypothetical protein